MDGAEPAEIMEPDSTESHEKSLNKINSNITTENTVLSNEGVCDNHLEQNMDIDTTKNSDKLSNDIHDNINTDDSTVLSNEGVHEDKTEQNMEVDSVINHDVLLKFQSENMNQDCILSSKNLEIDTKTTKTLEQNKSAVDEIDTSDQPLKNINSVSDDKKSSQQVIEMSDEKCEKATFVSNLNTLNQLIDENISVSDIETSDQPINKNSTGLSEQSPKKSIPVLAVTKSDQSLKEITVETSKQPTKENIDESSEELIKKDITESDVQTSKQQLKENMSVSTDENTLSNAKSLIKTSEELIKKDITQSDVKTSEQQLKESISVSTDENTLSNAKSPTKTEYLNVDQIAVPSTSTVNLNQSVLSSQIKKVQPISIVSSNTFVNVLKTKHEVKIVSSSESKPGFLLLPHNGMKYVVKKLKKEEPNNESLKLNSAEVPEKKAKFVTLLEKCPNGTFKVISSTKQNTKNFIIKTDKQPVSMKYVSANGLRIVPKKSNTPFGSTSLSNLCTIKKDIKLIPHTITSKDLIESKTAVSKSTDLQSNKNTNANQEMKTSSNLHLLPKTEYLSQSGLKPLSISKFGKISQKDSKRFRIVPISSMDKPKWNINTPQTNLQPLIPTVILNDKNFSKESSIGVTKVFPDGTYESKVVNSNTRVEKISNKKKLSFTTENVKKKRKILIEGNKCSSNDLASCGNEDCDAMVFESEMVDNMYCSADCKKLAARKMPFVHTLPSPLPTYPKIDRKSLLQKLQNSIKLRKKKQLLVENSKESTPNDNLHASDKSSIKQTNVRDKLNKTENVSNDPKIYPEPSDYNTPKTSYNSSSNSLVYQNNSTLSQNMNIPIVPQLADEAYLRSIEEGNQILNYVKSKEFKSASKKLFDKPFPVDSNTFKVNHKLEGIDPEHEALFCVLSVAEIRGYRLKLHFDGYSSDHDFWVNADCPDIFHVKWCLQYSRPLQPPYNYGKPFEWSIYLRENRAFPAPKSCFTSSVNTVFYKTHKFCVGAKLEALDKATRTLPKQLICVATVADVMGSRIRVHFDGWTDDFDYWTCISSTNLHPIGWCDSNGRCLTPPCGYHDFKGKKPFSWTEYLKETNSEPVPEDAFIRRPLREFTIGMAIEVVDLVIPSLIRVAVVKDVKDNEIKILYDGFTPNYAYWVEDDSPDIHPIGWCFKTHHPLEIPPEASIWSCKVAGCNGKGNLYHYKTDHINAKDCPYEFDSWKKSVNGLLKVPDRLKINENAMPSTIYTNNSSKSRKIENLEKRKNKNYISSIQIEPTVVIKTEVNSSHESSNDELSTTDEEYVRTYDVVKKFKMNRSKKISTLDTKGLQYTRCKIFGELSFFTTSDPKKWSAKEVGEWADRAVRNENSANSYIASCHFIDQEIDGESFLMLTKNDLLKSLHLPLGPAIKIYHSIKMLQERSVLYNTVL